LFKTILEQGGFQIVIPLIVINELDGLKVNPAPLGPAAADAIRTVDQALTARKLRVVTQQGNMLTNLAFRSQILVGRDTEDGAANIDAFIIETVRGQAERHSGRERGVEKAVLVTGDMSMRVIASARGVMALTAPQLRKELDKARQADQGKKS
jgi:predicted ribonuclease YlaK